MPGRAVVASAGALYFAGMFGARDSAPTRISYTQIPTAEDF